MLKQHALSLFFLINSGFFSLYCQPDRDQQKLNSSNAINAWDYHEVLVKKDWSAMTSQIGIILKEDWKMIGLIFSIPFWITVIKINKTAGNAEELIDELSKKYPSLGRHSEKILNLINLHQPIPESVEILKNLKNQGYSNYLASNIGEKSLAIQIAKHKDIFDQFEGIYKPPRKKNSNLLISKPSEDYYNGLRFYLTNQKKHNNTIIFIDDKEKNIRGARASNRNDNNNIDALLFTSPEQLKRDLESRLYIKKNQEKIKEVL